MPKKATKATKARSKGSPGGKAPARVKSKPAPRGKAAQPPKPKPAKSTRGSKAARPSGNNPSGNKGSGKAAPSKKSGGKAKSSSKAAPAASKKHGASPSPAPKKVQSQKPQSQKPTASPKGAKAGPSPSGTPARSGAKGSPTKGSGKLSTRAHVPPGRKFVKHAGAVLAQPQTPKASIRTPVGAEELKARIGALSKAVSRVRALKRNVNESFWEIATLLQEVELDRLFEVKGYAAFDSFVDREIGMSKRVGVALARVPAVFVQEAAEAVGLERVLAALEVFDGDEDGAAGVSGSGVGGRSPIPYHKQ